MPSLPPARQPSYWTPTSCCRRSSSRVAAPLASKVTASELMRVLGYPKFKLSADEREELLADYLPHCRSVRIPAHLPKLPQCRGLTIRCSSSWRRQA